MHRPASDPIHRQDPGAKARLERLWAYYRNPALSEPSAGRVRLAQERGLPRRLTGVRGSAPGDREPGSAGGREIVIENDIAWRIHTMVDFMFGRPLAVISTARDEQMRRSIERLLDAVLEASGGVGLLADIGLLGHVYGFVDLLVRTDLTPRDGMLLDERERMALAQRIRVEPVEPTRATAVLDPDDYRRITAYTIRGQRPEAPCAAERPGGERELHGAARWLAGAFGSRIAGRSTGGPVVTEVFTADSRRVYVQEKPDGAARLVSETAALVGPRSAGDPESPPIAHIQNTSQPFRYEGLSEVEPLIPLQDELNTRLSDRASRVTMQSFKMYLAKGLDGAPNLAVGPGQVWMTDNPEASVEAFGGDGASPSEDAHIEQVREALDKASGVPPLASGVVRAKIGNLTSENALRVTLMGLLSKTARKRVTYGRGLAEACRLILLAADRAGILKTEPADRAVRIEWPDPLPRDERDLLDAARAKLDLGIPRERILGELGYVPTDPGIV